MLTINLITDQREILPHCSRLGIVYNPGLYLYRANDDDSVLATGVFEIQSSLVETLDYITTETEDQHLFDGVLRGAFNYAASQGIESGLIPEQFRSKHLSFFKKLNFPIQSTFSIENFFSKYKNCRP